MKKLTIGMLIFVMITAGCASVVPTAQATNEPLPTLVPLATFTQFPTQTPLPTYTPYPSPIPTPGIAMFTPNTALNCRLGPSTGWKVWVVIQPGQFVPIIGMLASQDQFNYGNWLLVNVSGARCWAFGNLGTISGDWSKVAIVAAPVFPTAIPTKTPKPTVDITVENNLQKGVCTILFYNPKSNQNVWKVVLQPGEFPAGSTKDFYQVPIGTWNIYVKRCGVPTVIVYQGIIVDPQHTFIAFPPTILQ